MLSISTISSGSSVNSSILKKSLEDIDHEIDPIENFKNLDLNGIQSQFQQVIQLPVHISIMTFNLNPYNRDINPSTNEGLKLFFKSNGRNKGQPET